MNQPLYIFDIDGTVADCRHRLHYIFPDINDHDSIHAPNFKADWDSYGKKTHLDAPIWNTIRTLEFLQKSAEIWFFTGRSEDNRLDTSWWLCEYINLDSPPNITMRPLNDTRRDTTIKQEMINNMLTEDRERLVAVFDDRKRVVDMWRKNDIMCYHVCEGLY